MSEYYFRVQEQGRGRNSATTIKYCKTPKETSKLIRKLQVGDDKNLTREIIVEVDQYKSVSIVGDPPIDVYSIEQWFDHGEAKYEGILSATGQSSPLRHIKNTKTRIITVRIKVGRLIKSQVSKLSLTAIFEFIRNLLGS